MCREQLQTAAELVAHPLQVMFNYQSAVVTRPACLQTVMTVAGLLTVHFFIADTSHTVYDAVKQLENRNQCSCPPSHTAVVHAMQAISLALVAYATFAHQDASLESAVSTKALQMPGAFDPPAIANTLWALALLDDLSPSVWDSLVMALTRAHGVPSKPAISHRGMQPAICLRLPSANL